VDLPSDLRQAIDRAVVGVPVRDLTAAVERLVTAYRAGGATSDPILRSAADVTAYAAYRMPATFAAVRAALAQVVPSRYAPATQVDIGGGTGAAAWAAAYAFPTLMALTVLDQVGETLALGGRLAAWADAAVLRSATWLRWTIDAELPPADLVTISYVLGELTGPDQADLVRRAGTRARDLLLVVEPGTPAGYERVLAARDVLLELGLTVVAPCPHQARCPIIPGRDWCHFGARVSRSPLHRRLKDAERGYEDEKFSYVAAVRGAQGGAAGRVLSRPQHRKGLVSMRVCTPADGLCQRIVSRREGDLYRAARDAEWGDAWPPHA
jgi:ribosomal protein RSM22 (predicted rRNA methylase)